MLGDKSRLCEGDRSSRVQIGSNEKRMDCWQLCSSSFPINLRPAPMSSPGADGRGRTGRALTSEEDD